MSEPDRRAAVAAADTFRALLRIDDYRRYLVAVTVSGFGDRMLLLVLGVVLQARTGSSSAAGLVGLFLVLPSLTGPVLGTIADRTAPRRLFTAVSIGMSGVVMLTPVAVVTGRLWLLYGVAAAAGLAAALTESAEAGTVPGLVPPMLLGRANALLRTAGEGSRVAAPALGGLLYQWLGVVPVAAVDVLSFAAVVVTVPRLRAAVMRARRGVDPADAGRAAWARQSVDGVRHLVGTRRLRSSLVGSYVAFAGIGFLETAIYATTTQGLREPAAFVAVLSVAQGIGAVPAGLVAGVLMSRVGARAVTALGLAVVGVGAAVMAAPVALGVVVAAGLESVGLTWFFIGFGTAVQQLTPAHLQGRAAGSAWAGLTATQLSGILLGAGAGLVVDYRVLLAVVGAASLTGAVVVLPRRIRR